MIAKNYIEAHLPRIEETLAQLLNFPSCPQNKLFEAARYSVLGGGKRWRPLIAIATASAFGCPVDKILVPACCIELIHCYSLIHDDLPCMDDDDFRRGKPSLHKKYDEAIAVLTGDFLLTYAFQVLSQAKYLTDKQKLHFIETLSQRSGGDGMVAGQLLDIEAEKSSTTKEEQTFLHQKKTAELIACSFEFGAIAAEASEQTVKNLYQIGLDLGLAFQIQDDILDVTESVAKHGKQVSSDQVNGKSTFVSLYGIDVAKKRTLELKTRSKTNLKALNINSSLLTDFTEMILP
jgi:geranylgeranyl diphosphate synthase type II